MTKEIKVQGDTIIYNGATYKKVEEPKEPTLRDIIAEVLEDYFASYEYAEDIETYNLAQHIMNHIIDYIPDYSHNDEVIYPNNVTIDNDEDFKKGWNAHAKETFKVFDWCIK